MFVSPILNFEDKSLKNYFIHNNQSMLIITADFQQVLEANQAAIKTYGYTNEEITLQPVEKIISQNEQQKLLALLENATSAQQQIKKEISLINSLGKTVYAEVFVSAIFYAGKEARLFTMTDITEKKLYRNLLEDAIEEEVDLKSKNQQLKKLAYLNFHLARKPLANILGLVNVLDQSVIFDQTLVEALEFLKESSNQLDELIKGIDPQLIDERL